MYRCSPVSARVVASCAGAVLALAAAWPAQAVTLVFADSFDDGDVSDWSVSKSANVSAPVVSVRTDSFHSGPGALWTYFDAPGGGTGAGFVRATHSFTAAVAGDYFLDLWARSSPCSGCTMYFDILVDGVQLLHDGTSQSGFSQRTLTLAGLSAGVHTLTLGMFTDGASNGRFQASFDDVSITTNAVPEPASVAMMLAGAAALAALRRRG
jgi:hypothetical protein